jgi:hypothetical protein
MPPAGFEPAIPASERPQTHSLDSAATGIGTQVSYFVKMHGMNNVKGVSNSNFMLNIPLGYRELRGLNTVNQLICTVNSLFEATFFDQR